MLKLAKQKFIESESDTAGTAAYNLACVCAELGEASECRHWLEISREPGLLVSREKMAEEHELESVRDSDWFRELLAK